VFPAGRSDSSKRCLRIRLPILLCTVSTTCSPRRHLVYKWRSSDDALSAPFLICYPDIIFSTRSNMRKWLQRLDPDAPQRVSDSQHLTARDSIQLSISQRDESMTDKPTTIPSSYTSEITDYSRMRRRSSIRSRSDNGARLAKASIETAALNDTRRSCPIICKILPL